VRLIAGLICLTLLAAIQTVSAPVLSAAEQAPEQVVFNYLRNLYVLPTARPFSSPQYPDQGYCSSYVLLSTDSRAKVKPQDFLSYARNTLLVLVDVDLSDARINGNQATLRAKYVVEQYHIETAFSPTIMRDNKKETRLEFYLLTKEDDGWRIVLDNQQFPKVLLAADAYRQMATRDVRFGMPPDTCGP
jgi:hypothetical protein